VTLTEYLGVLRRQWWVVLLLSCLSMAAAAAYTASATPIYTATTRLFVSVTTHGDVTDLSSGSTFTQQRVKSYADIVTSRAVLQEIITELRLPYTPDQLAGEITAESPLDTVLLDVSVSDPSPERAAAIANALAVAFPKFVDALETPRTGITSPVKVSVTQPSAVPTVPVSPRVPLNLALGLLVGLGLGVGAAVLRDQLNTSISGIRDIEKITGAIPLGVVPFDKATSKQPLVDASDQGGRAEAFRTLRTNLQFTNVDEPPRTVVVSSPLPSEGKSTTACNIALTLALSGASVVLVEGDLRLPSLDKYLGLSNAAGLTSVLAGQHDVRDVIVSYQGENLAVLPAGPKPPNPSELLGSTQMSNLLGKLGSHFDYVVIDAPPLLPVTDAAVLAAMADGCVLVTRHGKTTRESLDRAVQSLAAVNARLLGTVLNFAPARTRNGYDGYGYGYGYGSSRRPADAVAPVPRQRPEAPNLGRPSLVGADPTVPGVTPVLPGPAAGVDLRSAEEPRRSRLRTRKQ
jgi:capsular exopolysaccharide synthesis family protein